ncbi:MAG: hypothetical protein GC158_10285 [Cyanobacteria bacterium RI_101]|nr:hypothetical protein [Cyanobacteria bacterium RI_101]
MTKLLEIEMAIQQLPERDIRQLADWLESYLEETWDRQIESDLDSGKLERLISSVQDDISANRVKPLDEVLNNP